jgi:hypothetical protein
MVIASVLLNTQNIAQAYYLERLTPATLARKPFPMPLAA